MMKCAEKQPLGQSELAHGCSWRAQDTEDCLGPAQICQSCPSKYHMLHMLTCENAEAEADEGSLAFGFREPFSKAARTVRIEVKSGLSKEILEDLLRIQTALE